MKITIFENKQFYLLQGYEGLYSISKDGFILPQINHKDGNKLNNKIDNLEWCSASHNTKHAWQNSLIVPSEKFKERASRQFIKNLADKQRKLNNEIADNIIEIYNNKNISMKKLGALFNVSSQTVCNIIHGKRYLV